MILKISRFWIYLALATPIILTRSMFFPFITGKQIGFRVCVELALAFFLIYVFKIIFSNDDQKRKILLKNIKGHLTHPVSICLAVFCLMLTLSALVGPFPSVSFWSNFERGDGAFQILHYVIFALLIKILFTSEKQVKSLFWANIIASLPVSYYAIGQMFANKGTATFLAASERVSGTLGNPSYLACYLAFNLVFIGYLLMKTKDRLVIAGLSFLGLLQTFLIIKAGTRGVAVGVFIGLVIFAIHLIKTSAEPKVKKTGKIALLAVVLFAIFFFSTRSFAFWQNIPLFNRFIKLQGAYSEFQPRLWAWSSALQGFADKPILGWGLENFSESFDRHYNPSHYGRESFFDRTHNVALEYLIGGGLLSFVPWLLIFYFYYKGIKKYKASIWKSVCIAVPAVYLGQGMFLFDVLPIYITLFLFLIGTLALANETKDELPTTPKESLSLLNYATLFLTSTSFVILIYITAYLPIQKNLLISRALQAGGILMYEAQNKTDGKPSISPSEVVEAFQLALIHPSPIGDGEALEMYQRFALDIVGLVEKIKNISENENAKKDILGIVDELNNNFNERRGKTPGLKNALVNAGLSARVGILFNSQAHVERAVNLLEQLMVKAPTRIEVVHTLLQIAQQTKNQALWDKWIGRAIELRPDLYKGIPFSRETKLSSEKTGR